MLKELSTYFKYLICLVLIYLGASQAVLTNEVFSNDNTAAANNSQASQGGQQCW